MQVDATDEDSVARLINGAARDHGALDILHNNVGASLALGDAVAVDLTEEAFDLSFAVNLKSHWLSCKHAIPIMREKGGGSIVNISSLAALEAYPLSRIQDDENGAHRADAEPRHGPCRCGRQGQRRIAGPHEYAHGHRTARSARDRRVSR